MEVTSPLPAVLLTSLVTLLSLQVGRSPVDACTCMRYHPQIEFCRAKWVIKGKIKSSKLLREKLGFGDLMGEATARVVGVKISKVYKEAEGLTQGAYVKLYTPPSGGLCGVNPRVNETYVIKGGFRGNTFHVITCDFPEIWDNLSPVVQKGYGYLYKKNCKCTEGCNKRFERCGCDMKMRRPIREEDCYFDHAVCAINSTSMNQIPRQAGREMLLSNTVSCAWSKRGLFYKCMEHAKKGTEEFDWEP